MDAYELDDVTNERRRSGERYLEFIHASTLSTGIYELGAGGADPQRPHTEDEVYYVIRGRASIHVAGEDRPVQPGTAVFAPPRGSQAG